ncbi:NAD-dependent epimerase/dehydratase family protein [Paraburkholderia sp. CI3]|uniref:NAD-dependent epimerase/dehydratase family protein n=1 Tax=Paraburkholderia sp. CI3 TaxID=2991060 RepID=UPI003D23A5FE
MANILITGITGFIGRYLAQRLRALGHTVTGTTTTPSKFGLVCDLRDREATFRVVRSVDPEIIFHLAALSSVTSGTTLQYYETNLVGTENLMHAVDSFGDRRRFIFLSTAGVYGNQATDVLTEDLNPLPVSHYGISKFACERLVGAFGERHDITIARPFNVVGVGQNSSFIVPKLIQHFVQREPSIRLGRLDPVRDYIDVNSCCDILGALLARSESIGQVVNVCSGRGTSVRQLLTTLTKISGHEIDVISAPEFIRSNEVFRLLGSTEKLENILQTRKSTLPIEDTLRDMLLDATLLLQNSDPAVSDRRAVDQYVSK